MTRNHKYERGDTPVSGLLLIGLIALPLVFLSVTLQDEIVGYVESQFIRGPAGEIPRAQEQGPIPAPPPAGNPTPDEPRRGKTPIDPSLFVALLAGIIGMTAYAGKRVFNGLDARARLLIREELSRGRSLTRPEAGQLLRNDIFWFRLYRNVHIDILAELLESGDVVIDRGIYRDPRAPMNDQPPAA